MAHSYFPDLAAGKPERTWAAVTPPGARVATVPRVAWLATALLAGLACVLATVFAGMWWRGEMQEESARISLERLSAENTRLAGEQSRHRRVSMSTKLDYAVQLAGLTDESTRLREALEAAQTEAAVADLARRSTAAQLDEQTAAARQLASSLQQEQSRAANLEQNLMLTRTDHEQRAAQHDQQVGSLQTNLISLKTAVTEREIEVHQITNAAVQEVDRTRLVAQEASQEAEWLAAQLRTVTCERDQWRSEVLGLQNSLASERAANQSLACRISQLECRIRELESRPITAPAMAGGPPAGGGPGHGPGHGRPEFVR